VTSHTLTVILKFSIFLVTFSAVAMYYVAREERTDVRIQINICTPPFLTVNLFFIVNILVRNINSYFPGPIMKIHTELFIYRLV
jgi:hypothetical protein